MVTAAALTLLGSALPAAAAGSTWYVDQQAGTDGASCGQSAASGACATIGAALARTVDGDTVAIAAGTYAESLTVTDAITLQGASESGVVLSTSSTDGVPALTIDADGPVTASGMTIAATQAAAGSASTAAVMVGSGRTATLSQVTVTTATEPTEKYAVGVVAAGGSTLTLDRSTVTGFPFYGVIAGTVLGSTAPPAAAALTVTASSISGNGGGIAMYAGKATLTGGSVTGNASNGLYGYDPGVEFDVTGTSITGNGGPAGGTSAAGVVLQQGGTFTGTTVTVSNNSTALVSRGAGNISLTDSTVSHNGGSVDGAPAGGGIVVEGSSGPDATPPTLTIDRTEVSDNTVGVQAIGARTTITASTFTGNSIAGIAAQVGDSAPGGQKLELAGSTVTGNGPASPVNSGGQTTGGLAVIGVDAVVTDTDFKNNTLGVAVDQGSQTTITGGSVVGSPLAGVVVHGFDTDRETSIDLTGTSVTGNGLAAGTANPWVGGIVLQGGSVTGHGLTVSGNANGVMVSTGSTDGAVSLTDSVISDNVVGDGQSPVPGGNGVLAGGGGDRTAHVTLTRTEVSGNAANGLWLVPGTIARATNSTIAGNGAAGISSAVPEGAEPGTSTPPQLLLAGSTVAGNAGGGLVFGNGLAVDLGGSILQAPAGGSACVGDVSTLTDDGYNLASDGSCDLGAGTSAVGDPLLGALADNSGPTRTMLPGPGSPAVNAVALGATVGQGDQAAALCAGGSVDQRGTSRPKGSACDIGAAERTSGLITVTAGDATRYRGETPPTVTPAYAGFAGTDTAAGLDTPANCGFDETAGTTSCHGAADDFYDFTYVPGVLTVLDMPAVTTTDLPDGQVNHDYAATVTATGGAAPLSWSLTGGRLPTGLTLHPGGTITGSPTEGGPYTITVTVTDDNGAATDRQLSVRVDAAACQQRPFPDVAVDDENCPAIAWIAGRGITAGYSDGNFHPERSVTRQTMAAFLYRYAHDGSHAPACDRAPFSDVPASSPFCGAIAWLVDEGVTAGYGDGTFRPTRVVTNQTMAALLYRLGHEGDPAPECTSAPFPDVPVSNTFCGAIAWIADAGIATGDADGFHPADTVTRGPMAGMLYFYDQYQTRVPAT